MIFLMMGLGSALGILIGSIFMSLNMKYLDVEALKIAGRLGFFADAIGRVSFGALADSIGFKKS